MQPNPKLCCLLLQPGLASERASLDLLRRTSYDAHGRTSSDVPEQGRMQRSQDDLMTLANYALQDYHSNIARQQVERGLCDLAWMTGHLVGAAR